MRYLVLTFAFLLPTIVWAQSTITTFLQGVLQLINGFIIPLLVGIGIVFFIINVLRYFIMESDNDEGRAQARQFMLYAVIGLTIIVTFWAIIAFIVQGFGFQLAANCRPVPDYIDPSGFVCDDEPLDTSGVAAGAGDTAPPAATIPEDIDAQEPGFTDPLPDQEPVPTPGTGGNTGDIDEQEPGFTDPLPDQEPVPTPGAREAAAAALAATQAGIESETNTYLNSSEAAENFGESLDAIRDSGLFADLVGEPAGAVNDLDRLQAAYRLQQLGAINNEQYTDYFNAINANREAQDMLPITQTAVVDTIATPPPSIITANNEVLREELRSTLLANGDALNPSARAIHETNVNNLIDNQIFADNNLAIDRFEAVEELFGVAGSPVPTALQLNANNPNHTQVAERFRHQANTESVFAGDFGSLR